MATVKTPLKIVVAARWIPERDMFDDLDMVRLARDRGHGAELVSASDVATHALKGDVSWAGQALVCRFSSDPLASLAVSQAKRCGVVVVGSGRGITFSDDQEVTLRILESAGLPVPHWYAVRRPDEIASAVADWCLPVVTKEPATMGGSGVRLAASIDEVRCHLLESDSGRIIVEEFHPETAGCDLRLFVVGERVVGAIRRTASQVHEFRANLYLGATFTSVTPTPRQSELAIAAATAVGLDIAGVDILTTVRGDLVVEVNHNPGATGIDGAAGAILDLVERAVYDAERE